MRVHIDMPQPDPKITTVLLWMIQIEDSNDTQTTIQEVIPEDDSNEDDHECNETSFFANKPEPMKHLRRDGTLHTICLPPSDCIISHIQGNSVAKSVRSQSTQTSKAFDPPAKRMDYSAAVKSTNRAVAVQPTVVHPSDQKPEPLSTPARKASVTGTMGPYHGNGRRKGRGGNRKPKKVEYHAKPKQAFGFEKKQRALDQPWR